MDISQIVERFGVIAGGLIFMIYWTYKRDNENREREERREKSMTETIARKDSDIKDQNEFVQKEMLQALNNNTAANKDVAEALAMTVNTQRQTLASLDALGNKLDLRQAIENAKQRANTDSHNAVP
jgi:ATP-dependent Lon protease